MQIMLCSSGSSAKQFYALTLCSDPDIFPDLLDLSSGLRVGECVNTKALQEAEVFNNESDSDLMMRETKKAGKLCSLVLINNGMKAVPTAPTQLDTVKTIKRSKG